MGMDGMPQISFRHVRKKDLHRINEILNNPDVNRYLRHPPYSMEEILEKYERMRRDNGHWYAILYDGEIIGGVWMQPDHGKCTHMARISTYIEKPFWGKGIGTKTIEFIKKVAKNRGIKKLNLHVFKQNIAAIRAYEKNGFKTEGVREKEYFLDGGYHDTVLMGCWLEDEYMEPMPEAVGYGIIPANILDHPTPQLAYEPAQHPMRNPM